MLFMVLPSHRYQMLSLDDKKNVDDFLAIIQQTDAKPVTIIRLGKRDENKTRPIKIKFNLLSDKQLVMSSLSKLKEAPDMSRKISVTEDYTIEERAEIMKKVKEAKNKTETEGEGKYTFKVRGTPKNGLKIVRVATSNQATLPQREV